MTLLSMADLEAVKRGYDSVAERSKSLNASSYVDPRYVEVERAAIFRRSWQFLCHREKLSEAGRYVAAEVAGQGVFAVRGEDGILRAFYNVCKHRAHELVSGEGRKKLITCPYHAWSYRLDGALHAARRSEGLEDFHKADYCLTPVGIEEFCSLVFVNLDPDAVPLAEATGDLAAEIDRFAPDIGALTFAHRLRYSIKANWKTVIDNFLECNHCPVAHKDFCTLVDMETYRVTTHGIYSSHMAKAGRVGNSAYGTEDATVTDHAVWFLWPNTALMRYPGRGNFMVWRFIPHGPEETLEQFDFFFESAEPNTAEWEAIRYIDEVLQVEDIGLVESVQRGMRTPAFSQGRYMIDRVETGMSEHAVHHFHGLVLKAYESVSG